MLTWVVIIGVHYKFKLVALHINATYLHVWICVVFNLYDFTPVRHLVGPFSGRNSHIVRLSAWVSIRCSCLLSQSKEMHLGDFKIASKCDCECLWLFVSIIQPFEAVAVCPGCTQPPICLQRTKLHLQKHVPGFKRLFQANNSVINIMSNDLCDQYYTAPVTVT